MHVLHIITNLSTGGAELMLKRLVTADAGAPGRKHSVISLRGLGTVGPQLLALGVEVEALEMQAPAAVLSGFGKLIRLVRAKRPDVVITWMYHADLIGGIAARLAGVRNVVWSIRISDITPEMGHSRFTLWIRKISAWLSPFVPKAIIYVAGSARQVHEQVGYDATKSVVIRNGYFFPDTPASPGEDGIRAEIGIPSGDRPLVIGTVGRFHPQKDHHTFVQAAALVAREHPQVRFVMIGRDVDESNAALREWVKETGFADRFHLLGERSDVARLLPALDIFCLHSIGEGFPNVVAEAMAAGLPCVVTDVGDAAYLVDDTGIVVPPSDPEALARGLSKMIEGGEAQRAALGGEAYRQVRSRYSMDAVSKQYHDLYDRLVRS